ncbi:MAG: UDP-2,4-diacetamido-2,4,6-trideoxy-beta-L-altropyranose hydrolase [Gammaproteobacteria bacterium SHHR-1]
MSSPAQVIFRVDASPRIGTGHLMRCLALAELFLDQGHDCTLAYAQCPPTLLQRAQRTGLGTLALSGTDPQSRLQALRAQLLVLDGYQFTPAYRRQLAQLAGTTLALDDAQDDRPLYASHVLNSSPQARPEDYRRRAPQARLLLGMEYAPLRQEFLRLARPDPVAAPDPAAAPGRILISLGGSDILNLGPALARLLLDRQPGLHIDLVMGAAATSGKEQAQRLAKDYPQRLSLHQDSQQMARLMQQADLAITAAGSTLLELAYMALPGLALVVADNQAPALRPPYSDWFQVRDLRQRPDPETLGQWVLGQLNPPQRLGQKRQLLRQLAIAKNTRMIPERVLTQS